MPNCTISLVQPEVVGKVRGFESQNVTFCFEPQRFEDDAVNLVSAECVPRINPLLQAFISRNATMTDAEATAMKKRTFQYFNLMTESGDAHKMYVNGAASQSDDN